MTLFSRCLFVGILGVSGTALAQPSSAPASQPSTQASTQPITSKPTKEERKISLLYTGKSLGALGVFRDPDEHQLLLASAKKANLTVKFFTYTSWRAPGVTIFSSEGDLDLGELPSFLSAPSKEPIGEQPALLTNNVTMLKDPSKQSALNLLELTLENENASIDFPGLSRGTVTLFSGKTPAGKNLLIVEEKDAIWPSEAAAWSQGIVNRVDVGDATLYELAVNLGEIGPRATLIKEAKKEAMQQGYELLVIDLGERSGDMGLSKEDRARVDYTALSTLGYQLIVPYEFELDLGLKGMAEIAKEFPSFSFLATNLKVKDEKNTLLQTKKIIELNGIKVGFLGMVDKDLKGLLSKQALSEISFEDTLQSAKKAVKELRAEGVDAVVVLSNMYPPENALLAREVKGIDAIVADLHTRWSPEDIVTSATLPPKTPSRPGSPALVTRGYSNGFGVGQLDMVFQKNTDEKFALHQLTHQLSSVTDNIPADPGVVSNARTMAKATTRPRGSTLFPSFSELAQKNPKLLEDESASAQNRITKSMWESFLARLLRQRAGTEVSVLRRLPHFPPTVGSLSEADVRAWLWTEESLIILDLPGKQLKALINSDKENNLVIEGLDRSKLEIHGRGIDDTVFYRTITTDFLVEGPYADSFSGIKRKRENFIVRENGSFRGKKSGEVLSLREYVLAELARLRTQGTGEEYLAALGGFLVEEDDFEPLLTFTFDHLTVFTSFSQVQNNEGFGAVPESRINSADSLVIGVTGDYILSYDLRRIGFDLSATTAFSNQVQEDPANVNQQIRLETADELKFDFRTRFKLGDDTFWKAQPFLGATYDTEFTPTIQEDGTENPIQQDLRASAGVVFVPSDNWKNVELSGVLQNDLASEEIKTEIGLALKSNYTKTLKSFGKLSYRWTNDVRYFLPSANDDESDLALRYNMVHELLLPFLDDLSLSIAADFLFFQGKVVETQDFGYSAILRLGLSYDRLWKPRYQSLF